MLCQWYIEITNLRSPEEKETRSNILIIALLDGQCSVWSEIGFCFITLGATVEYFAILIVCSVSNCWMLKDWPEIISPQRFQYMRMALEIKVIHRLICCKSFQSLCFEIVKGKTLRETWHKQNSAFTEPTTCKKTSGWFVWNVLVCYITWCFYSIETVYCDGLWPASCHA